MAGKNINSFYPKTAAGLARWMETVAVARQNLVQLGNETWSIKDEKLKPLLENKKRGIILSFVAGTSETGLNGADLEQGPSARRKQGPVSSELYSTQEPIVGIDEQLKIVSIGLDDSFDVWVLLYYRDEDEIRAEISLPEGVAAGRFTGWKERIILEPCRFEYEENKKPIDVGGGDIEFEIIPLGD